MSSVLYHFFELMQNLQVKFEEEAESKRTTKLNHPSRSRGREGQLVQKNVVGPAEGLVIPRPEGNKEQYRLNLASEEEEEEEDR